MNNLFEVLFCIIKKYENNNVVVDDLICHINSTHPSIRGIYSFRHSYIKKNIKPLISVDDNNRLLLIRMPMCRYADIALDYVTVCLV